MEPVDRLDSWKEIAAYLQRDVRTVQRWEATESLPIHRHQHKKRGSVYALREELDAWRESRRAEFFTVAEALVPEAPAGAIVDRGGGHLRNWLLAVALIGGATALAIWANRSSTSPSTAAPAAFDAPRPFSEVTREGGRIERISLGGSAYELALSPDDRVLYVALCGVGVSGMKAIDLATRLTLWTRTGMRACPQFVLSPRGDTMFIADGSDVIKVALPSRSEQRFPTPAAAINDLAIGADGRTLYAAAVFHGLLAINTATGEVETISKLPCPTGLALTPTDDRLYVNYQCSGPGGSRGHDSIDVLDTRSHRSVGIIKGLANVGGDILASRDGSQIWVDGKDACHTASYDHVGCPRGLGSIVNVIRTADLMPLRALQIGSPDQFNLRLSMSNDGSRVVAGRAHAAVLSTATLREIESVSLSVNSNVVFTSDGRAAYGVIGDDRSIAILPMVSRPAPPRGLAARWTFDGLGVDLVAENDFQPPPDAFTPGRVGQAVRLTGLPPLRLETPANLRIDGGFATAMAWINVDAAVGATPMTILEYGSADSQGPSGWRIQRQADGLIAICLGFTGPDCNEPGAVLITGTTRHAPGSWHHVAMVRDERKVTLFVDGVAEATGSYAGGLPNLNVRWFRLGSDEGPLPPFSGRIDEVEIYGRSLTAAEISDRLK